MSDFGYAFNLAFLGSKSIGGGNNTGWIGKTVTSGGVHTSEFSENYGPGVFDFVDPKTYLTIGQTPPSTGQPLVLVASSTRSKDKLGKMQGGYMETPKSKIINPKFVTQFYRADAKDLTQSILSIGNTSASSCGNPTFYCGGTYDLRVDVKGNPAFAALHRNLYHTVQAIAPCCEGPIPEAIDSLVIYKQWAQALTDFPQFSGSYGSMDESFFRVVIEISGTSTLYVDPRISTAERNQILATLAANGSSATIIDSWDTLDEYSGDDVGIYLISSYVSTTFGKCTYQPTDATEVDPLKLFASMVDLTNEPCVFEPLCIEDIVIGTKAQGLGRIIFKNEIYLSEMYRQNPFSTSEDLRIREITGGSDVLDAFDLDDKYAIYYIQHFVPGSANLSNVKTDQPYLLKIVVKQSQVTDLTDFENFVNSWLSQAGNPVQLEVF